MTYPHAGAPSQAHPHVHSRTRLATLGLAALATLGLSLAAATPALAHDELVGQSFATDADDSVTGVVLHFNNEIMNIGTEILVTAPSGEPAAANEPEIAGREVIQSLVLPLETSGTYELAWRVVSSDGHPIQGLLAFEAAADGTAEFVSPEDHSDDHGDDHDHDHSHDESAATPDENAVNDEASDVDVVTTQSPDEGAGLSVGSLVAVGIVVVLAAGLAIVLVMRRKSTAQRTAAADPQSHDSAD